MTRNENIASLDGISSNPLQNEQMCGGRNGDEFGQSLNDAEQKCLKNGHVISIPAIQ